MSINKVILVGNVGKDPVIRYFDKGVVKATFPLATSETYTNQQGETITSTEWHNIVLWRSLAEVAEKTVKKGSQLYIVGKIKTRSYVDKDGNNKYITEILADTMIVLEKKQFQSSYSGQSEQAKQDLQDKSSPVNEISEPGTVYNKPSGNVNQSLQERDIQNIDDPGPGGTFNNGSGEDDLPF